MRQPKLKVIRNRLAAISRNDFAIGTGVVVSCLIVAAAIGIYYVAPTGTRTISFLTTDASSISVGQDVRVAGLSVGKVTEVELGAEQVLVEAKVEDDISFGDQTRVEVRMLTPVGGYAVTVIPAGRENGSARVIPADQVSVPYSIGDVIQAAPTVTDEVDGETIERNITEVADGLTHNSASVGSMVDGLESLSRIMDKQRSQVARITRLSAEYLRTFNDNRDFVFDLIRRIEVVETTYHNNAAGFNRAYALIGKLMMDLLPFDKYYLAHEAELRDRISGLRDRIGEFGQNLGPAIDRLQQIRGQLERWMTPRGMQEVGAGAVRASDVCVPVPGRTC